MLPNARCLANRHVWVSAADVDSTITSISRGFPGPELLALIRQRASVPLLLMLRRVLETFTPSGVYARRCGVVVLLHSASSADLLPLCLDPPQVSWRRCCPVIPGYV